ncbi:MAG: isoamylase early set domain-containing protein [Gemmatimonadota bacterium]
MPRKQPLPDKGIVRVTFTLPAEVEGRVVHLAGEFTGWEGTPMERQTDGSWQTVVDLAPGRSYQYRYQIDGIRWENDWEADHYVGNPFGQDNSVVETPPLEHTGRPHATWSGASAKHPAAAPPPAGPGSPGHAGERSLREVDQRRTAAKQSTAGKTPGAQATRRNVTTTEAERSLAASEAATGAGAAPDRPHATRPGAKKAPAKKAPAKKAPAKKAAAAKKKAPGNVASKKAKGRNTPPGEGAPPGRGTSKP